MNIQSIVTKITITLGEFAASHASLTRTLPQLQQQYDEAERVVEELELEAYKFTGMSEEDSRVWEPVSDYLASLIYHAESQMFKIEDALEDVKTDIEGIEYNIMDIKRSICSN